MLPCLCNSTLADHATACRVELAWETLPRVAAEV